MGAGVTPGVAGGSGASVAPTQLTPAQRARFDADGYLAPLDALTPAEAAALRPRLDTLLTPDGELADVRLRNKPHLVFTWVSDLVSHPRVLDAVGDLLGPDLLVWRSVFFVKPPRDASYVSWHQDAAYWDLSDARAVTVWIALTDSTADNGAVRVVPGTHRGGLVPHRPRRDARNRLSRGQVACTPAADAVAVELRAGQFSVHHSLLLHSSPPNPSHALRAGLAVRYITSDIRTGGPRQTARLVRGTDRFGYYDLEPLPRRDHDPVALACHARALRRYGLQALWQIVRSPTLAQLAVLARLARRPDLLRAILPLRRD
jgi:hypothetical protein